MAVTASSSPLMEYRDGRGTVLFCQMDVTGRTETDPAAETLARNLLQFVSAWKATPQRKAIYIGDAAGKSHLESVGISVGSYDGQNLSPDQVLIVGPGDAQKFWRRASHRRLAEGRRASAGDRDRPS